MKESDRKGGNLGFNVLSTAWTLAMGKDQEGNWPYPLERTIKSEREIKSSRQFFFFFLGNKTTVYNRDKEIYNRKKNSSEKEKCNLIIN